MTRGLFEKLSLGPVELQNRIVVSPMCQYSASYGVADDWHIMHIGQFAVANPGLIFLEGTAIEPDGRISTGDLSLYTDEQERGVKRLADFVKCHSRSRLGVQLFHAGRKGSQYKPWETTPPPGQGATIAEKDGGWRLKAPSAIAYSTEFPQPSPLSEAELQRTVDAFVKSAKRADRAGLDVLELHFAHGYLLHSFLSPVSNQRHDKYGGTRDNRMRFPLAVFAAVREVWPETKTLGARISGSDFGLDPGSWTIEDAAIFGKALRETGCDFLDVSGGFLSPNQDFSDVYGRAFQVDLAHTIKSEVGLPTIAVGAITSPKEADDIIVRGAADAVALGRGMLYDPRWPWHAAHQLNATPRFPPQYERAFSLGYPSLFNTTLVDQL